ncbi:MAG: IS66 family insertion sequence element accessory protein TnpB [Prevotella sp.]|nr:IS66 family insertion sequence element accessory protein TnpB [Prevotella sp.]
MPEIHKLRALEGAGRETGGFMLAITSATKLYYVAGFTDMRYGKYALANVIRYQLHRNPYNGVGYMFMSKDRQKMKILVYSHNLYRLYDLSYDKGLSFMKIENEDGLQ